MKQVKCCGAVIFCEDTKQYLLVQAKQGYHWGFPKGHMEPSETEIQTAIREVREEIGISVNLLDGFKETISYTDHINNKQKTVVYFLSKVSSPSIILQANEIADFKWLSFSQALSKITHQNTKEILKKAQKYLVKS